MANLFSSILNKTFSLTTEHHFNDNFKKQVEDTLNNLDFNTQNENSKDIFDLREIKLVIKHLNIKSTSGEDQIHNLMLLNSSQDFMKIILYLINQSIKQAKIPQNWKTSLIKMIPKKQKNISNPRDYRPISLTSCLAKVGER